MQPLPSPGPTQEEPLVSVLLPVNRDHEYLDLAVQSIVRQTYANLELILIANGCSDSAWERLQRFNEPRVRLIRTQLRYLAFALNLGIHVARGGLIARMDSDDLCHAQRLERQVLRFALEPALTVLGTRYELIDADGITQGMGPPLPLTDRDIRRRLPYRCALAHPTVMFRREPVERVGGYMYGSPSEDYDLWLRLSRDKAVVFAAIAEPLLSYRIHDAQETAIENRGKILAFDFALKMREFLVTGRWALLLGAAYSIVIFLGSPLLRWIRASREG